jgi:hypothetical protein
MRLFAYIYSMVSPIGPKAVIGACGLALLAGVIACGSSKGSDTEPNETGGTLTPSALATPIANVCQPNPDPATPEQIRIDQPMPGGTLSHPAIISGTIVGSEGRFRLAIVDAVGQIISASTLASEQPGSPRSFSESLDYYSEDSVACIWVYELTADDLPVHIAQVPVGLSPSE